MGNLRKFSSLELVVSRDQAKEILTFFFGHVDLSTDQLTDADRSFAQALMVEALDASNNMSYVEALFRGSASPSSSIITVAANIVRQSVVNWWRKKIEKVVIYDSVKNTITVNFKSVWAVRVATGELMY